MNTWWKISIWALIESGAYGNLGTQFENFSAAVLVLRSSLMSWYVRCAADNINADLTRVADLTTKMLGSANDKKLKTKGAETWGVALFLIEELQVRSHMLGDQGDRLRLAGEMLERVVRIWKMHDWTMPRDSAKERALAITSTILICSVHSTSLTEQISLSTRNTSLLSVDASPCRHRRNLILVSSVDAEHIEVFYI